VSPLLHDYKAAERAAPQKSKRLQWFVVGLGIPLAGLLLVMSLTGGKPEPIATVVGAGAGAAIADSAETAAGVGEELLPVELPVELVTARPMPEMAALPGHDRLELTIHSGDTLDRLFRKNNLDLGHLAAIASLPDAGKFLKILRPGDELRIEHDNGKLVSLYRELDLNRALLVSRNESGFAAEIVARPIEIQKRLAYGRIEASLFESAAAAGMPDKLIMSLAGIFAWDIDFVLDIRKGDDYYILYEEIYQDGRFITSGEIIAAEFNNNGRTFQAVRFVDENGRSDYFTPEGRSVRKAFIRAPVDFTRISSASNPNRRHPILNTIRAHRGVDYAAPGGTPIKAAGDGKVIFRGRKGGYGNAVIIQHGGNITTLYAHMSKFANSARISSRVRQGDVIGYVGATGLATAPHLHYEYQLNGVHRNPRTVELPQADPIKAEYRDEFLAAARPLLAELSQFKSTQVAMATE
jgi:murein DD-endopeptidase MepM/ murein hydrolase activator NlpD